MNNPNLPRERVLGVPGKLVSYSWPGGYPVFYLDGRDSVLCPNCANEADTEDEPIDERDKPVTCGVNWEDPDLYCDQCSGRIESAYAED